jgi:hypothetical protein
MCDDAIAALHTLQEGYANRPKNTTLTYNRRAEEFSHWCIEVMHYPDSDTVTGKKLHRFLREQVCGRKRRVKKRKRNNNQDAVEEPQEVIGFFTLRTYKSAIIDLYMQQKGMNMNNNEHPGQAPEVKSLLDQYKRGQNTRNKENYTDRGHGTILEGFITADDLHRMSMYFFEQNKPVAMRNRLMFLLSHYTVSRGENIRAIQLADMFALELDDEGYSACFTVALVMGQGKRNQFGRKEVGSFLRNKNVLICPMGALAIYFFVRYQIENNAFPSLWRNADWYDLYLVPGTKPGKELSFGTHYKFIKNMLYSLGIKSNVKTHMGRGTGAQMADVRGASEPDIRRSGRWNQEAVSCYLTMLPRETMRTLAGFPKDSGHFYIARSILEPPSCLLEQVFPDVTDWAMIHGLNGECEPDPDAEHSIATDGFLSLMIQLRTVLLQDAVFLREILPNLFLWKHPIFNSPEFDTFAVQLRDAVKSSTVPEEQRLQQAVPLIANKLTDMSRIIQDHHHSLTSKFNSHEAMHSEFHQRMAEIFSGRSRLRILSDSFPEVDAEEHLHMTNGVSPLTTQHSEVPSPSLGVNDIPAYTLSRSLSTVHEVWKEYTLGIGYNPSVKHLEDTYGTKWRKNPTEQRYFCRRKILYDRINEMIIQGFTESDAVRRLEALRESNNLTLDALQKKIHKKQL